MARSGPADDGGLVTYYEFPQTLQGARFEEFMPINDPTGRCELQERGAGGRQTARESVAVHGLLLGHEEEPPLHQHLAVGGFSEVERISSVNAGELNPNAEINQADRTWDWDAKSLASYTFPADVLVSANFHHRAATRSRGRCNSRGARPFRRSC